MQWQRCRRRSRTRSIFTLKEGLEADPWQRGMHSVGVALCIHVRITYFVSRRISSSKRSWLSGFIACTQTHHSWNRRQFYVLALRSNDLPRVTNGERHLSSCGLAERRPDTDRLARLARLSIRAFYSTEPALKPARKAYSSVFTPRSPSQPILTIRRCLSGHKVAFCSDLQF